MARQLRNYFPDVSLHVFNRGNNRTSIFDEDIDREWFLATIQRSFQRQDVSVHNFVLMTTHFHLLVTPAREDALPKAMKEVGQCYTKYFNRKYERTGGPGKAGITPWDSVTKPTLSCVSGTSNRTLCARKS